MLKWCPCMGWCLTESSSGEKVLLTSMATPAYNVRRISSFGQTVINDSGEEEEIARHGSIPVTNGKSNSHPAWSAAAVPVQPGVTKSDVSRMHKMASIPELSSPKQRNRLKKGYSDEKNSEMSPLRTRKKIPTPQDFAEVSYHQENDGDTISIISETNSELSMRSKYTDDDKAKSSAPGGSTPDLVHPTITEPPKTEESYDEVQKDVDRNGQDLRTEQRKLSIRGETDERDEEDDNEDDEGSVSRTNSASTTQIDELDEVILDGSKELESSEIAKQFGLDLSLYDNDINTNIGLRASKRDDQLSANTSIAKLHFTTYLDKDTLQISLEKVEGLGGIGPKNVPFDLLIKLGIIKSSHIYSTKPSLSNKPINQNFSIHVKDLANSILRISLFNNKWIGSHDALGHALFRVNKCCQSVSHHTVNVSPKSDLGDSAGIIEVSFRLESKVLHVILHKLFDILPAYRGHKVYTKVSQFISSKKIKEKISKTEPAEKGYISLDFESKFKSDGLPEQHTFIMISLKKKSENNKLFKNDKTLGRVYLGPLFFNGNKLNLWGQAVLEQRIITHNFTLYL